MANRPYREFLPSHRDAPAKTASRISSVPAKERVEVSVYLKPRKNRPAGWVAKGNARKDLLAQRKLQHADDIKLVRAFAKEHGLNVTAVEPARRLIKLGGTAAQMQAAFRCELARYKEGKKIFRGRSGALSLPNGLLAVVESVLGLDTRPAAKPHFIVHPNPKAATAHLPNQVAALYQFPTTVNGAGQAIALIELGGGYAASDTKTAFKAMGLAPPTLIAVSVDGGKNKPKPDDGANGEVALDIQVAGGAAPGAAIVVYFAPNTDAGFVDAITQAAHDTTNKPNVISISWGSAESQWTQQAIDSMNSALQDAAVLGVSVFVASGDNLATDGVSDGKAHVDFPASSPWAVGCGGTNISVTTNTIANESVWNDGSSGSGGGISDLFAVPSFQQNVRLPPSVNDGKTRRGVPDVAADAAPGTGYRVVVNGTAQVVGGTSAVAPLWAGLATLINQKATKPIGFFLPKLYANPTWLREITQGNNEPSGSTIGYSAGPGWNACTGLGIPNGQALFAGLSAGSSSTTTAGGGKKKTGGGKKKSAEAATSNVDQLAAIEHLVVLMLENRSFDHMLGFLYADTNNVSAGGQAFEGLSGKESNPDSAAGTVAVVFKIAANTAATYFQPGADPGEGYAATNAQLFGNATAPSPPTATNRGFVDNYATALKTDASLKWSILKGTTSHDIMGMHTPQTLPVLSALARGYAVCDHWYASAPTETLPNRAFVHAATSQGHMDDKTKSFTAPTVFGALTRAKVGWMIYGYDAEPLTRLTFPDTSSAPNANFGKFADFQKAAAAGTLPAYTFLEPSWGSSGNSQHPNYNVALGEQLIHDVYYALRNGPGWSKTLLIVTYDEHGGCYDHVPPPAGATPPDTTAGEFGFDFKRFGVRVPTVLISPLIAAGTVFRAPAGATPFDHTSILKTIERRWNLPALTARDAAAVDVGAVLTLSAPRSDDPLAGVAVPAARGKNPAAGQPSHLQQVYAELAAQLPIPKTHAATQKALSDLHSEDDYAAFIQQRVEAWKASRTRR
jgi:phospholipase C